MSRVRVVTWMAVLRLLAKAQGHFRWRLGRIQAHLSARKGHALADEQSPQLLSMVLENERYHGPATVPGTGSRGAGSLPAADDSLWALPKTPAATILRRMIASSVRSPSTSSAVGRRVT